MAEQEAVTGVTAQVAEGAKPATSPDAGAGVETKSLANGAEVGAGQPASPQVLPFHQNPEAQKWLSREQKRWERDQARRFDEMKSQHQRELDLLRAGMARPQNGQPINHEGRAQLKQLAEMLFGDDEIRQQFGLDRATKLEKEIESLREGSMRSQFDSELKSVVSTYSSKYGFQPGELEENLKEFIEEDPVFSQKDYRPGAIERAAKAWLFDHQGEVAERAANLKLIKEQEEKKKVSSEAPSGGNKGKPKMIEKSLKAYLDRREQEEGGITFD